MFTFLRSNTYTVDGLKNMRSSILTKQARYNAKISKLENTLMDARHNAMEGRRQAIASMEQELVELSRLV